MPEENLEIKQIQVGDNTYNIVDEGALRPSDVVDNVTSTYTAKPLSANQGKVLQDQITNLKTIGRFLSILDSAQGTVSSQPSETVGETYNYKVGDYYRIGAAGNYFPKTTATYTVDSQAGHTNFETHEGETLGIGDVIYCSNISGDTSTWVKQAAGTGGTVQDVQVNDTTVVSGGQGKIYTQGEYNASSNKIATMADIIDSNVKLSEDLYVYTNVGLITASSTNPAKVGTASTDSIKDVFNTLFVGQDADPTVNIPTLSINLNAWAGYSYDLVKGEIIEPKFTATYSSVNGSYEYKSQENPSSTSTNVTVLSSSFTAGDASIAGTITNQNKTQTLTGSSYTVNTSGGQAVSGTVNFNLADVYTAKTKLGKKATAAKSGSTGTLDSSTGKLNTTKVEYSNTISITSSSTLTVTKPSISITNKTGFPPTPSYIEIGQKYTPSFKVTKSNWTGTYPYGYWDGSTKQSSTSAGCTENKLTVSLDGGTVEEKSYNTTISFSEYETQYDINSRFAINANGKFNCDTSREPLSQNNNRIDVAIGDYRINGSSSTYTASISQGAVSWFGYVPAYYGFKTAAQAITDPTSITSEQIKTLGSSVIGQDAYSGTRPATATTTGSWKQFFIAIPVQNGWGDAKTPTAKDGNNLTLTVASAGTKSITFGSQTISYTVYYINHAASYDNETVKLTW